jgi:D-beta-D-heptose 7-phosphate kinase/D-beta-D-heptose 1-phosphate adenosyltransferase
MGGGQQLLRIDEETMGPLSSERARPILNAVGEALAVCKAVILSDYGKGVLWTPGVCREIIGMCRRKDIPVLVDPKGKAWDRYSGATCITPNGMELAQVADMPEDASVQVLEKSASEIRERFELEWLLTTLGAKGMLLVNHKASPMWLSARTREVFDVSGAGDTVIAAVAAGVARGLTVPESAAMANVAAGLVVGKVGTQPVTAEELTSALTHGGTGNDGLKRQ